jgi:hypothetical protein
VRRMRLGRLEGLEVAVEMDDVELTSVVILVFIGVQGALRLVFSNCVGHDCKQVVV